MGNDPIFSFPGRSFVKRAATWNARAHTGPVARWCGLLFLPGGTAAVSEEVKRLDELILGLYLRGLDKLLQKGAHSGVR